MASGPSSFNVGRVISGCLWLLNRDLLKLFGFVSVWVVARFALSLTDYGLGLTQGTGLLSLNMLVDPFFVGVVYLVALNDEGLGPTDMLGEAGRRYLSLLGLSILSSLGIVFGLLLLLLPGIALVILWSIAVPVLLNERTDVTTALKLSFRYIRPHFWAVLGVFIIYFLVLMAVLLLTIATGLTTEAGEPGWQLLFESFSDILISTLGIYFAASIYREATYTGGHDIGVFD